MLSDLITLKTGFIGIPMTDTTQDQKLASLLFAASEAVKRYCKRTFEISNYIWYPPEPRLGGEAIVTPETPVLSYRYTGTITSGLATITGLPSVTGLITGMTAIFAAGSGQTTQPFPNAATITAISTNPNVVTMSGNATSSLNQVPIIFGCSVWFDPNGSFGDGPGTDPSGPFGPTTLILPGFDYALQRDRPDGTSGSGKLIRLAGSFAFLGMGGAWNPFGSTWGGLNQRATLTAPLKPLWPTWPPGSIKVQYAGGVGTGAANPSVTQPNGGSLSGDIPADLTAAVNGVAAWMWQNADAGLLTTISASFGGYSQGIKAAEDALKVESDLGGVRQMLSHYRKVAM